MPFCRRSTNRDGTKATEALKDDATLINTRHPENGETALAIVAKRRDATWLRFLLAKDADPAIADKQGMTPLMHAALLNFTDGAEELLNAKAPVDQTNRRGETALILAVQTKNVAMVRLLMRRGANPDKADHATGMSRARLCQARRPHRAARHDPRSKSRWTGPRPGAKHRTQLIRHNVIS